MCSLGGVRPSLGKSQEQKLITAALTMKQGQSAIIEMAWTPTDQEDQSEKVLKVEFSEAELEASLSVERISAIQKLQAAPTEKKLGVSVIHVEDSEDSFSACAEKALCIGQAQSIVKPGHESLTRKTSPASLHPALKKGVRNYQRRQEGEGGGKEKHKIRKQINSCLQSLFPVTGFYQLVK